MAAFPKVGTGVVAQYPSARLVDSDTTVLEYVDGSEQRFRNRSAPVNRWLIRLGDVATRDLFAIETFFLEQQGQYGSFSFTDPWDGTEYPDCSFEQEMFEIVALADGRYESHLMIRNNAS